MPHTDPEAKKAYHREYNRKYRQTQKHKAYLAKTKDANKLRCQAFYKTVKGKYAKYREGAKKRGYRFEITFDEFKYLYEEECFYCGQMPAKGVDRYLNDEGYHINNCNPCCKWCNIAKSDGEWETMLEKARAIVRKFGA
jgi:hypothetical protein